MIHQSLNSTLVLRHGLTSERKSSPRKDVRLKASGLKSRGQRSNAVQVNMELSKPDESEQQGKSPSISRRKVLGGAALAASLTGPLMQSPLVLPGEGSLLPGIAARQAGLGLGGAALAAAGEAVWDGQGRQPHIIITGSNTGIGKAGAEEMVRRGWAVTLACRSESKAQGAVEDIKATLADQGIMEPGLAVGKIDLASLASVREFASSVERPVDVLWNNAGVMAVSPQQFTQDGFEYQFGINHLGHFLLTCLLEDQIKAGSVLGSEGGRVVSTSSLAHTFCAGLDLDDPNCLNREYKRWGAYGESKLANILFTRELDQRAQALKPAGATTGVTAYSFHPGVVDTELGRYIIPDKWMVDMKQNPERSKFVMNKLFGFKTPAEGADTGVFLSVDKDVEKKSAEFFDLRKVSPAQSKYATGTPKNMEIASQLWEKSLELTGAPTNAWTA